MAKNGVGKQINDLVIAERWPEARKLIEKALKAEPESHWLLTQLAETYYEERNYKKALEVLLRSREIVPDCPLTLWHLAGTLDALGYHGGAIHLYTWLLRSQKTADEDPCWESETWTDALKTDCVYCMGLAFKHAGQAEHADHCLHKYLGLLAMGSKGSYTAKEVRKHLEELRGGKREAVSQEFTAAADCALEVSGESVSPTIPPQLDKARLKQLQEA
jgi:tetratricopeptide (TPR) repeat protein